MQRSSLWNECAVKDMVHGDRKTFAVVFWQRVGHGGHDTNHTGERNETSNSND